MSQAIEGACLCGRVRFRVTGPFDVFHLCHCSQCRRASGSAHVSNLFTEPNRIKWLAGKNLIKRFVPDEAGVISKCFCTHCGSPVPYTSPKSGKLVIPAGLLSDPPGIEPNDNIFWHDRATWYEAGIAAPRIDQEPVD